jgi:hypothetical protein
MRQEIPELDIKAFATTHRLHTKLDDDNTTIIPGKDGQIYQHDSDTLGLIYQPAKNAWKPKTWGNHRRNCEAAGMTLHQNGDSEGTMLFDPKNGIQAKLAVKVSKCRAKRILSPEQLERLKTIGIAARERSVEAHYSRKNASVVLG